MARSGRHPKGGRVTPKGTRPTSPRAVGETKHGRDPSLLQEVRAALASPHPLALLQLVSALLALDDERPRRGRGGRDVDEESSAREQMVSAFLELDRRETSAVLAVIGAFTDDDVERRRIRRALADRRHQLPDWIAGLDDPTALRAVEVGHVLGDATTVVLGLQLPTGHELTTLVYIDHTLGDSVKDAFAVPAGIDDLLERLRARRDPSDSSFTDIGLADAKARISEAMAAAAITVPPVETETWPGCRPLVAWAIRRLPDGGTGYVRPEWDDDARSDLMARFLASPFAEGLEGDVERRVEPLIWYGCDYGTGDPLRLSPLAAEILLVDWIPRKIVADVDLLTGIPNVLRAFVRFGHDAAGIRSQLTDETLAAIDEWEPTFQSAIRTPRPQGVDALFSAMHAYDPEHWPAVEGAVEEARPSDG